MISVQLEPEIEAALTRYATVNGITADRVIANALHEYLDDSEDSEDVKSAMLVLAKGGPAYGSVDIRRNLGLDD